MISTRRPSAASQIVRIGRPLTFMSARARPRPYPSTRPATASSRASSAGSRALGRGDQRVVEGMAGSPAGTARHAAASSGTTWRTSALAFCALASSTLRIVSTVTASWSGCQQS